MDRTLLNELIDRITAEVLRRVKALQEAHAEENVVLLTAAVSFPDCLKRWLEEECGSYTLVQLVPGSLFPGEVPLCAAELGDEKLTRLLYQAKRVLLACPEPELLRQLAAGRGGSQAARLMMKAILWKKETALLLDYEPPKFRRNTFLGGIAEALETLRDTGVQAVNYCAALQNRQELLTLVTEQNVLLAARTTEKRVCCTQNAILTPAARDAAKEHGVTIQYG